jgi:hypothetical protein
MILQDQSKNYMATKLHTAQAWLGLLWSSLAVATITSKHLPPGAAAGIPPRSETHITTFSLVFRNQSAIAPSRGWLINDLVYIVIATPG